MILKDGLTINTFSFLNLKLLQTKFYNVHSLLLCLTLNLTFNHMDFKININSVLYAFIQRNTETKSNKNNKNIVLNLFLSF